MTMTAPPPAAFSIAALMDDGYAPYQHEFPGNFVIHYGDVPADMLETLAAAVSDDLTNIGFADPLPTVAGLMNQELTGEERLAFDSRRDSLTTAERIGLVKIQRRMTALMVAGVVKSWSDPSPVTPEACALLPPAMQATILELASKATLTGDQAARLGE